MYSQLGGIIDSYANMGAELLHRASSVPCISNSVHAHITGKASLTLEQHAIDVDALVLSSLLHNCQTWCGMTEANRHNMVLKLQLLMVP